MHRQRNIYQSRTLDLLRNCLSEGQDGGSKQRGQTVTISLKALLMPRLAVCSRDLHWHWINWTLLCETMEVSMLRLAWLPIAQHVFQPALTGRLELISRKIVSSEQEQRLSRWADFAKNCLPWIECKELPHYELPMEKKVPWNGAVSMRSRAGSWETLSICITLRHNQGAPADMHANALGILIICRFPLA